MHINFTGHQVDVTPALREFAQSKFENRINKKFDNITSINITFAVQKLNQIAEATIHVPKNEIHARSESNDLYSAIDQLVDKLVRQIVKHKEKIRE